MGLALIMSLLLSIISAICMIFMMIKCFKVRHYWKKVWIFFLLYILGALISAIFLICGLFGLFGTIGML